MRKPYRITVGLSAPRVVRSLASARPGGCVGSAICIQQSTICNSRVRHPDSLRSFRRTPDAAGPSRAARARRGHGRGRRRWRERGAEIVAPRAATIEQLARVHDREYLRRISGTVGRSSQLDPDTYTSPESHEIALLAAGAAIDAVERVMGGFAPGGGGARAAAGAPRGARSRDGVLPVQQRRGGGRTRARRAPRKSRSSTTTSTTATARSTSSRPIRTSSTSRRTSSRTTRAPARRGSGPRGGPRFHRQRAARSRRRRRGLPAGVRRNRPAGAPPVRAGSPSSCRPASTRTSAIRWAACACRPPLSAAMTLELRAVAEECCRGRIVSSDRRRLRPAGAGRVARRGDRGARGAPVHIAGGVPCPLA